MAYRSCQPSQGSGVCTFILVRQHSCRFRRLGLALPETRSPAQSCRLDTYSILFQANMGKDVKRILITGAAGQIAKVACTPKHAAECISLCSRPDAASREPWALPWQSHTLCHLDVQQDPGLPASELQICMVQARSAMPCAPRSPAGPCWAPTSPSSCTCWTLSLPSRAWRVSRWSSLTQLFPCCKASLFAACCNHELVQTHLLLTRGPSMLIGSANPLLQGELGLCTLDMLPASQTYRV